MSVEPGSVEHLSEIISHVVAPAFLLGAVASFTSILISRMNGVLERLRGLNDLPENGHAKSRLKVDIPLLERRALLLNRAALLSIASGTVAAVLIIVAFGAALVESHHAWVAATLFVISMAFLVGCLVLFGIEIKIGLTDHDHR